MLLLSCLRATELLEKRLHFSLSRKEKYQLKIHMAMCDACARYDKQSKFIENSLKHQDHIFHKKEDVEQLKKLIKKKIAE